MIKDEKLRDELFSKFPALTNKEIKDIQDEHFTHYSLYKRETVKKHLPFETIKADVYNCRCTRCGCDYTIERKPGAPPLKHKSDGICPECGKPVIYLARDRGKRYIWENSFFAVLHVIDGDLYVSCYDVYKKFVSDTEMRFSWLEKHRYCLTQNGVQHWKEDYMQHNNQWMLEWRPLKSENVMYGYEIINKQAVNDTFLRYASEALPGDISHYYLQFLCFCASHKGAEYLIKTGFGYLVRSKMISGSMHGIRLNWRSNNVKKMLRLNKSEMELLKYKDCGTLEAYYKFRKLDSTLSEAKRAKLAEQWSYYQDHITEIMKMTGLSLRKVTNYINKQGKTRTALFDWKDYIGQCRQLDYDLYDALVSMPKDLAKAHERLTRIIKIRVDEQAKKAMAEALKKRKRLEYTSLNGRYLIILPHTIEEIVDEGKRLNHCVGGYAQRHAEGKLNILFLRTAEKPDVPYYTMEVNTQGKIVQCRGFKNNQAGNPKPQEISNFEKEYQLYLDKLFKKKGRKTA